LTSLSVGDDSAALIEHDENGIEGDVPPLPVPPVTEVVMLLSLLRCRRSLTFRMIFPASAF
jgi:hypothetical protein